MTEITFEQFKQSVIEHLGAEYQPEMEPRFKQHDENSYTFSQSNETVDNDLPDIVLQRDPIYAFRKGQWWFVCRYVSSGKGATLQAAIEDHDNRCQMEHRVIYFAKFKGEEIVTKKIEERMSLSDIQAYIDSFPGDSDSAYGRTPEEAIQNLMSRQPSP